MPDVIEKIDDRTFFILYALTKNPCIEIPIISMLYNNLSFIEIDRELKFLSTFDINIKIKYTPRPDLDFKKLEMIEKYKTEIIDFIENKNLYNISLITQKLLPDVINCEFSHNESQNLKKVINNYIEKSLESRKLYFYNKEKHIKILKKIKEWAMAGMSAPYKIGFDRFLTYITEPNKSKYAFFHFLYQLEQSKNIQISELGFQNGYPLIIFDHFRNDSRKKALKKDVPQNREIVNFETLHLFENSIVDTAQDNKFFHCDNIEVEIFKHFFRSPYINFSYADIAKFLSLNEKDIPKRISKARKKLKTIVINKNRLFFINDQKNKTYKLTNPES